jgi:hypothetical protein
VFSFTLRRLYPLEKNLWYQWTEDYVGPIVGLDAVVKKKRSFHCPCRELNPGRPARSFENILLKELAQNQEKGVRYPGSVSPSCVAVSGGKGFRIVNASVRILIVPLSANAWSFTYTPPVNRISVSFLCRILPHIMYDPSTYLLIYLLHDAR